MPSAGEAGSLIGLWALFLSAFISSTLAPGGSELILAGLAAGTEIEPLCLVTVATLGNTLGALTTWGLGYVAAKGYSLERWSAGHDARALRWIRRWGTPVLLLSWLPIIGDALCLAAGWLRLPFLGSLLAIAIGKALRYIAVIYAVG